MTKSVIIAGNFGATNIGDEALLESILIQLQRSSKEDLLYYVLTSNPEETQQRYAYRFPITSTPLFPVGPRSIIKHLRRVLGSIPILRKASFAIFGGGGLFTDEASLFAVIIWFTQFCYLRYLLGQKVHIVGQSFGPLNTGLGMALTKFVLKRSSSIFVRDVSSVKVIKGLGKEAIYSPDLAFQLDPGTQVREQSNIQKTIHVAVSLRPWHNSSISDTLLAFFKDISSDHKILLHLIPMQYVREEDVSVLNEFQKKCKEYNIEAVLHRPGNYSDVLDILETCHLSIGMRLHFLIFSALVAVPFIPLSYSTKVKGVMNELGVSSHVLSHITVAMLREEWNVILENLDSKKEQLREAVVRIKEHSSAVHEMMKKEGML